MVNLTTIRVPILTIVAVRLTTVTVINLLRGVLASPGRTRVSQIELAKICRLSPNTIKKVEFASRRLSTNILTRVKITTGASWDSEQRRWNRYDGNLFAFADYLEHRERILNRSAVDRAIDQIRVDLIKSRIDWLFENVPVKSWEIIRSRVDLFLEEIKREYQLPANDTRFYRPSWLGSAKDSSVTHLIEAGQQKRGTPRIRGRHRNVARRKPKYGQ